MTYDEALAKFPEMGDYNANDLELILTGARLVLRDDDAVDALVAVVEHMEQSLTEGLDNINNMTIRSQQ